MNPQICSRPGSLVFPANRALLESSSPDTIRITRQPTGHLIAYGPHGRRILATDPNGHPLHECEWNAGADGTVTFVRARVKLDWEQWVGLKPRALVHQTVLDLSRRPGWQQLRPDDLRQMASRALGVPFEEVKFFYADGDLLIDRQGRATIRHAKDALYALEEGHFDASPAKVRFMACMGAMHWESIDFLPVVELFQSLYPGTGSAAFELIRGLYDDQNQGGKPRPLRYRGIPPYPSEGAYRLFSSFFVPQLAGTRDPFPVFMESSRSHEITWLPAPTPLVRYVDEAGEFCVTVQGGKVHKVTVIDDPAGLSYTRAQDHRIPPGGRDLVVEGETIVLRDGGRRRQVAVEAAWGITERLHAPSQVRMEPDWQSLFGDSVPAVSPQEAYSAMLLYPEDEREIGEAATQPFVADHLEDQRETDPRLRAATIRAERVMILGFEAALTACMSLDRLRHHHVVYDRPAYAQRQAQQLWNHLARANRLDWLPYFRFAAREHASALLTGNQYDLGYVWIPFGIWSDQGRLAMALEQAASALRTDAAGFVVGPPSLGEDLPRHGLKLEQVEAVEHLPTVGMHKSILPRARLKSGLMLFRVRKEAR